MADWVYPDYQGGSIVNLMSSILMVYGARPDIYPPLGCLGVDQLQSARNLVLLVIDGLGYDYLSHQGAGSTLHRYLQYPLTSVAPPTTATAISTFLTGLAPQQHGLTGWYTYFRELGNVLAVLPFTTRSGGCQLGQSGLSIDDLYGHAPIFDRLNVSSYSLCLDWISRSDFNRAHLGRARSVPYRNLEHCFNEIARIIHANVDRKYLYAYWPGFDRLAHEQGVASKALAEHFAELDTCFTRLLIELQGSGSMIIITADHGFVDVPAGQRIGFDSHPVLKDCLYVPLCGEQRLAYAYVRPDRRETFEHYVRQHLSGSMELRLSEDLLAANLFGLGEPHPELRSRIGDYTLLMKNGYVIQDRIPGESPAQMVGFHGGLSRQEMLVPLILATA